MRSQQHINKYETIYKHCVQRACKGNFIVYCLARQTQNVLNCPQRTLLLIDRSRQSTFLFSMLPQQTRWWLLFNEANNMVSVLPWECRFPGLDGLAWKTWPHCALRPSGHRNLAASSPIASPGHESIYRVKAGTVVPLVVMSAGSDKLIKYSRKRVISC